MLWIFGNERSSVGAKETGRHGNGSLNLPGSSCLYPESFILGRANASPSNTQGGSPVRESRTPGSVRGVLSNEHPYRDSGPLINPSANVQTPTFTCCRTLCGRGWSTVCGNLSHWEKKEGEGSAAMSEHSLHERVAAAAEERRLSANRLTAYQRAWPKILRFARKCAP